MELSLYVRLCFCKSFFEIDAVFIMVLQCINPTASCLVVHRAGEISVWSYETDRRNVGCVRYDDGYYDPL